MVLDTSTVTPTTTRPPLWRSRDFLLLWSGQSVGELGSRVSRVAVPLLAAVTLRASVFQVSLLTVLAWLPYLLFSLPAGLLADRVNPRRLMIGCDLGRMVLMATLPLAAAVDQLSLWLLYVVVGLCGVLTVGFTVAYRSVVPRLVGTDQLAEANAKLGMSQDGAELVGPALGGLLVGAIGATRTLLVDALSFLVSAVTLSLIRDDRPETTTGSAPTAGATAPWSALAAGLGFLRRQPILVRILATTATSNFFVMASSSIEVTFLLREVHASSFQVGLVFSTSAVGGLVVGALSHRLIARLGTARIIWVAMAVPGPLYLLMPLAQPGWGLLLFAVGMAAFSANVVVFNVAAMSYRQRITPPELLGRVNAAFMWVCFGVIPVGALLGGTLGSHLGLRPALWICVLGTWSAAVFVVCSPLRRMRDLPVPSAAN